MTHIPTTPLNQTALAQTVADELGIPLHQAETTIATTLDIITRTVAAGHKVAITNFGTWRPVERPERQARNPQTGGTVTVSAGKKVRFRPSPRLVSIVNAGDPTASRRKRPTR